MKSIRRIATLFLAITLLLSALPEALAATASYTGTINENDVFFRTGASTDAAFHCRLKKKHQGDGHGGARQFLCRYV